MLSLQHRQECQWSLCVHPNPNQTEKDLIENWNIVHWLYVHKYSQLTEQHPLLNLFWNVYIISLKLNFFLGIICQRKRWELLIQFLSIKYSDWWQTSDRQTTPVLWVYICTWWQATHSWYLVLLLSIFIRDH
jgi:hypothetical protein